MLGVFQVYGVWFFVEGCLVFPNALEGRVGKVQSITPTWHGFFLTVFFVWFYSQSGRAGRSFFLFVTLSYNSWLNFDVLLVVWGGVGAGQGPVSGSRKLGKVGGVPPPAFGLIFRGRKQVRALFCRTTLRREGRVGAELLLSGCDNGLRRGLESTRYVNCVGWCECMLFSEVRICLNISVFSRDDFFFSSTQH